MFYFFVVAKIVYVTTLCKFFFAFLKIVEKNNEGLVVCGVGRSITANGKRLGVVAAFCAISADN